MEGRTGKEEEGGRNKEDGMEEGKEAQEGKWYGRKGRGQREGLRASAPNLKSCRLH